MVWQLDRMFDLTSEQEDQLQPKTAEFREWLRHEGFPKVITSFNQVLTLWSNDQLDAAYEHMDIASQEHINELLQQLVPIVQTLSLSFTEENAEHYRQYNKEKQEEWFEYAESDESKADARIDQLDAWFGHLSDQQIAIIEPYTRLFPNEQQIRTDNNDQWRERILSAALMRDTDQLKQWIESPKLLWTSEYTLLYQHNKQAIASMMKALFPTLTSKQKDHAADRVLGWVSKMDDTR